MSDKDEKIASEEEDDIITLMTADGREVDFIEIAGIAYEGGFYAILQPAEPLVGMAENEAIVFKVTTGEDGTDKFDIVVDEKVIQAVYESYEKLYEEATQEEKKKGKK